MKIPCRETLKVTPDYVPGMRIETVKEAYHLQDIVKLSSNENAYGPPASALEAAAAVLKHMNRYPAPLSDDLRNMLAAHERVSADQLLISHGLEEMIPALCRAYINPGENSIIPQLTFIKYEIGTKIMAGLVKKVPMHRFAIDLEGILNEIDARTKIIWICNPNNPTGTYTAEKQLKRFLEKVPQQILVVHDETYREFTTAEDYPRETISLLAQYPNLILMRSFSKAYGLAGFRVGYMMADPEIIHMTLKVREIFSVDTVAAAAAMAALQDIGYLKRVKAGIAAERDRLLEEFGKLPCDQIRYAPSQANFLYYETPFENSFLFEEMLKSGVIVRPIGKYGIRATIGLKKENHKLLSALRRSIETCEHLHHPGETA